jgi:hypothetical protein
MVSEEPIVNTRLVWNVKMDVSDDKEVKLPLYQVKEKVTVGPEFADQLKSLLMENDDYLIAQNITSINTPEGIDCTKKAIFLIICFLKEYPQEKVGNLNHYLFGELKTDGYRLLAAADKNLSARNFRFLMKIITNKPELVNKLVFSSATAV